MKTPKTPAPVTKINDEFVCGHCGYRSPDRGDFWALINQDTTITGWRCNLCKNVRGSRAKRSKD